MLTPYEDTGVQTTRAEGEAFLAALAGTTDVTLHSYGESVGDNPMTAATIGAGPVRVCVLASIHGSEPAPREAAFMWLRDLAETTDPALLAYLAENAWSIMPTGNPDRIDAGIRENLNSVDLNRDHADGDRTEPETQAIYDWLRDLDPVLILDLHETTNPTVTDTAWGVTGHTDVHVTIRARGNILKDQIIAAFTTAGHDIVRYPGSDSTEGTMRTESGRVHHAAGLLVETRSSPAYATRIDRHMLALDVALTDHESRADAYLYAHQVSNGTWAGSGVYNTTGAPVALLTTAGQPVALGGTS